MKRFRNVPILAIVASAAILAAPKRDACKVEISQEDGFTRVVFHVGEGAVALAFPETLPDGEILESELLVLPPENPAAATRFAMMHIEANGKEVPLQSGVLPILMRRGDTSSRRLALRPPEGAPLCETSVPGRFQGKEVTLVADGLPLAADNDKVLNLRGRFYRPLGDLRVEIGHEPAWVLAKWPHGLVVKVPHGTTGLVPVTVFDSQTSGQVRFIGHEIGESSHGMAAVKISGLRGLQEPLDVVFQNYWWGRPFADSVRLRVPNNPFASLLSRAIQLTACRIEPRDVNGSGSTLRCRGTPAEFCRFDGVDQLIFRPKHGGTEDFFSVFIYPSFGPLQIQTVVTSVITDWSDENGIAVTPDAQNLIVKGFEGEGESLEQSLTAPRPHQWTPNGLLAVVADSYLYNLRDAVRVRQLKPPGAAFLFQASGPKSAPLGVIGAQDVTADPPHSFIQSLKSLFGGDLINMSVESVPPFLRVFLDRKEKGSTRTNFVVSPGSHHLEVKNELGRDVCPPQRIGSDAEARHVWRCAHGAWAQ